MNWLGLDIGGANIKAATCDGQVISIPFRFWIEHERLQESLSDIISQLAGSQSVRIAATMTAELTDCFESRRDGVTFIVHALENACHKRQLQPPLFAGTDLQFRDADAARIHWLETAASNWAIMATFASRFLPNQTGFVVDMGSTTSDIIPVHDGSVAAKGKTDSQRLRNGELVYVGSDRTPVCSVVDSLTFEGNHVPIAREFFATISDAMLVCGRTTEDPSDTDTADKRPRTVLAAAQRIARMVCEDVSTIGLDSAKALASQILDRVEEIFLDGFRTQQSDPGNFICTGSGVAFVSHILEKHYPTANITILGNEVGGEMDSGAPAFATAVLAREKFQA
ncbi:hydantoinase/oxoprolinase family protein [Mariniblastus fucicola]|uniref:Hydantoinase/oxoprolinase n=1 Tax=Mariniblastus fucicola TaxID=980251 RepID=A0A5B9P748_9BACT|nr:hydantoinase/oxoprolinase family protein [Mariniblastus fucicola]QEG21379.1 Hydantoinase/oxoprolinase [Mariniblastus fucicola]